MCHLLLKKYVFIAVLCAIHLTSCKKSGNEKVYSDFTRNILLNEEWRMKECGDEVGTGMKCYTMDFNAKLDSEKVYLLEVTERRNIRRLTINNRETQLLYSGSENKFYSVGAQMNQDGNNVVELQVIERTDKVGQQNTMPDLRMHCLNKLFIAGIETVKEGGVVCGIDILVKNSFRQEKQAQMKYVCFAGNEEVASSGWPIFLNGNSENLYRNRIRINEADKRDNELIVRCSLYLNDQLIDENTMILK